MVAIAIVSPDPLLLRKLEQLLRGEQGIRVVGVADNTASLLRLIEQHQTDAVLADVSSREQLEEWRAHIGNMPVVALLEDAEMEASLDVLGAGAWAILPRSARCEEIGAVINAAVRGLAVLPHKLVPRLFDGVAVANQAVDRHEHAHLTVRELDVLAAMADGASNKAIARRLGISFHTVKFHIAAILAKLDADSRTEAVTKAAQFGLLML
jgi:DNA-binding NarL/FixJ family response regulator